MTVRELIERLEQLPDDAPVVAAVRDGDAVTSVTYDDYTGDPMVLLS